LGIYKRGELSKELEDNRLQHEKNGLTGRDGYPAGIPGLTVLEHYDEGEQSPEQSLVKLPTNSISERNGAKLRVVPENAPRTELVVIKPRLIRTLAGGGNSEIQEVSATRKAGKAPRKAQQFCCSQASKGPLQAHEDGLRHRAALRTVHHHFFPRSRKGSPQQPVKAAPISASNSATAAANIEARMGAV